MTLASAPHRELGLTDAEYDGICERLEREPNALELAVFSLMWSEHCAYKHSKKLLRMLPTEGPHILMVPGENADVKAHFYGFAAGAALGFASRGLPRFLSRLPWQAVLVASTYAAFALAWYLAAGR